MVVGSSPTLGEAQGRNVGKSFGEQLQWRGDCPFFAEQGQWVKVGSEGVIGGEEGLTK